MIRISNRAVGALIAVATLSVAAGCADQGSSDEAEVLKVIADYLGALDAGDFSTSHSLLASSVVRRNSWAS